MRNPELKAKVEANGKLSYTDLRDWGIPFILGTRCGQKKTPGLVDNPNYKGTDNFTDGTASFAAGILVKRVSDDTYVPGFFKNAFNP
jgi:hypothetical protein